MHEFDALRSRVEDTATRLATAQSNRRDRNHSLLDTLARLEAKFAAQEQELAYYRERIRPLEAANTQLSALMNRLLDMVDNGLGAEDDADDPVRAATAKAAAMLERDLIPLPPQSEIAEPASEESDMSAMPDEDMRAEDFAQQFDDVDGETLAAEDAADADGAELPSIVQIAAAAADDSVEQGVADDEAQDLVELEPESGGEIDSVDALADTLGEPAARGDATQPTAADIRALLERVEAAAAEVRAAGAAAGARPAAEDDQGADAPARRSGGAAA